ncbi:MAG: hypothetical protein AMXMBFR12_09300 [Candidatus Babeliales bacterium]
MVIKLLFLACFSISTFSFSKPPSLAQLLEDNKPELDERYYNILPEIKDSNADITFISSRDPENMSLEESFLAMIAQATQAEIIVETGTYLGDSTIKMARKFKQVHTIELGAELFEKAQKRFVKKKNIRSYQGDSAKLLPDIIKPLKNSKTVFFLDAHFSMADTAQGDENTPILTELEIIRKAKLSNATIIIDDLRMFYKSPAIAKDTFMAEYPTVHDLVEKLLSINSSYKIAIVYDVLIAFAQSENISVSPLVRAVTMSRLYDGKNYLIDHILAAELCIAHAYNKEKETLIDLGQRWIEQWSYGTAISQHYALWCGLIFMETEEYAKAFAYFNDAKKRGMCHWRLDWYMIMAQANCFFDIH